MYLRSTKKLNAEVYLNEPIGKDKDDNIVTLQEVLENDERTIEDEVDLKMKIKKLYSIPLIRPIVPIEIKSSCSIFVFEYFLTT